MAVSGRTSKASQVIATLCIVIYVVAVAFGIVRIVIDIGERRDLANREFQELAERATTSAVHFGFMSHSYQESIRNFLGTSRALLGAIITSSSGDFAFERSPGSSIVWVGHSPRFRTGIGFPGQPLLLPLRIDGQSHVRIEAIYSTINNVFLIRVLRDTLMAVLAALAIAFITLIVELTQKNRQNDQSSARVEPELEEFPELKTAPDAMPAATANKGHGNPLGLFTTRGNIGWESYTRERLESELRRCASFEQDLVFIVMEFLCVEKISDAVYHQFADEAVSFFTMRDLIFERGEKGISIIIPSADLQQGITKSEEFCRRIAEKLPETFGGRNKLYIGMSSRSGRLIEADRLMVEASTALEKTQEEPVSTIVAFKSDPEKYRKFIRKRS